jgi:hypothetical protein
VSDDEFLHAAEADARHRLVELRERRRARLEERVAGRTDQIVHWQADDDENDDDEALAALEAFEPVDWWDEAHGEPPEDEVQ